MKFWPVFGFKSCSGPSLVANLTSLPYGTCSHGSLGTDIILLSLEFEPTVQGFSICVIQRLAAMHYPLQLPATVDVVKIVVVLQISAIDSELVEGIEHAFHGEGACLGSWTRHPRGRTCGLWQGR
jgi:hypothetical protein